MDKLNCSVPIHRLHDSLFQHKIKNINRNQKHSRHVKLNNTIQQFIELNHKEYNRSTFLLIFVCDNQILFGVIFDKTKMEEVHMLMILSSFQDF